MGEKIQDKTEEINIIASAEQVLTGAVEKHYLEMAIQMRRNTHVRGLDELLEEPGRQAA